MSTLDVSSLKDGTAYAAIDGQRLDDFQPHVLRTHDYGATWQVVTDGLSADHFISVVRADPVQPNLLYAGSDAGAFVSEFLTTGWSPSSGLEDSEGAGALLAGAAVESVRGFAANARPAPTTLIAAALPAQARNLRRSKIKVLTTRLPISSRP